MSDRLILRTSAYFRYYHGTPSGGITVKDNAVVVTSSIVVRCVSSSAPDTIGVATSNSWTLFPG